jgi:HD-like signal output (HDOD) protein
LKNSILNNIKSLPPLSKTISDINLVCSKEDASIVELAKVIEKDPMIVANLIKVANSPLYGFGKEIRNSFQAVSLFGMNMTRSIAIGNSVRKLLNVDMQPYGITSNRFAEISLLQATLMLNWYNKIDKEKAQKLYLAAFLQETGTILISSDIIQSHETTSFYSEIEMSNNLAQVEKSYVGVSSAEVTAKIFEHWGFENDFIDMIKYSDNPKSAPQERKEYCMALNIVKGIVSINKPFLELSINFGLAKASSAGYDKKILEDVIYKMLEDINE